MTSDPTYDKPRSKTNNLTICLRSSDPFYIVSYYIIWVTTSWTHSILTTKPDLIMVRKFLAGQMKR